MLDIGFVMLVSVVATGTGLRVLRRLRGAPSHAADALTLGFFLGLGLISLAGLLLGQLGALGWWCWGGVLAAAAVVGDHRGMVARVKEQIGSTRLERPGLLDAVLLAGLGVTFAGVIVTGLAPVTDGDALCYHLLVPRLFLERGAVGFEPDLHETVYPLVTEMLYGLGLAFRGPVSCRLLHMAIGLGFSAAVTGLARPALGVGAWRAGVIALLVPAISNGMSAPLNDVALAGFATATLLAWVKWYEIPSAGRAAVAGILGGLAIGVKYPALVWVGLLGLVQLMTMHGGLARRLRRPPRWGHLAVFGGLAVLVGGGWYLRAAVATGNPVYPFFRSTFGGAGIDDVLDPIKRPLAVNPMNLLTALVPMTLEPDRFDSFSHQLGPAFLWFLPAVLLYRPSRRVAGLVAFGWVFLTVCLTQRQSMRFVLAAVGPLSVGVAWVIERCRQSPGLAARGVAGALAVLVGFESSIAAGRARHGWPVVFGLEPAETYLARREPTYVVGHWIDNHLPRSARIIGQDHRGFYIPRPYTMELAYRRRTRQAGGGQSARETVDHLRREGFTHLLMCPPIPETAVEFDGTLGRQLAGWLTSREPLYEQVIRDGDGVARLYAIYELGGEHEHSKRLARAGTGDRDVR